MAILTNGSENNPTAVRYIKDEITYNINEVWYRTGSDSVKVWPGDLPDAGAKRVFMWLQSDVEVECVDEYNNVKWHHSFTTDAIPGTQGTTDKYWQAIDKSKVGWKIVVYIHTSKKPSFIPDDLNTGTPITGILYDGVAPLLKINNQTNVYEYWKQISSNDYCYRYFYEVESDDPIFIEAPGGEIFDDDNDSEPELHYENGRSRVSILQKRLYQESCTINYDFSNDSSSFCISYTDPSGIVRTIGNSPYSLQGTVYTKPKTPIYLYMNRTCMVSDSLQSVPNRIAFSDGKPYFVSSITKTCMPDTTGIPYRLWPYTDTIDISVSSIREYYSTSGIIYIPMLEINTGNTFDTDLMPCKKFYIDETSRGVGDSWYMGYLVPNTAEAKRYKRIVTCDNYGYLKYLYLTASDIQLKSNQYYLPYLCICDAPSGYSSRIPWDTLNCTYNGQRLVVRNTLPTDITNVGVCKTSVEGGPPYPNLIVYGRLPKDKKRVIKYNSGTLEINDIEEV